ncbi:Dihydrolipoyllysine-residue acetyltransferase component of pyruvate dehydrogenase complex, partial [Haemophilus influenzae]
VLTYIVTG